MSSSRDSGGPEPVGGRLLRALVQRQHERGGHLDAAALGELAGELRVPLYRLEGLVSFYPHFRRQPGPATQIAVCRDLACELAGGPGCAARLRARLGVELAAGRVALTEVSCLGRCDAAPAATVNDLPVSTRDAGAVARLCGDPQALAAERQVQAQERTAATERFRIDPYDAPGERYATVRRLRAELAAGDPARAGRAVDGLLDELKSSGLRGMGGAGFPTAQKWSLVRAQPATPKYVVCNADESEPGTFKDRELLARAPHLVIEGMALAAAATGARRGIVYLRHEYGPEGEVLADALAAARRDGVLGDASAGAAGGAGFDIEVFVSPGGYILGEETALLEALEDRRGEPRNKPPFPGQAGLFGCPTLINNVETFACATAIAARGAAWWRALGREGFAGSKLMAVSGEVERPGVYEVPFGTPVAELIALAGGVSGGRRLRAFLPGGASSRFLPAERADVPLDFAALQAAGSMLGSGALVVVAEGTPLLAAALSVTRFFRNESCGKCVPCRVGSEKAVALVEQVLAGGSPASALEEIAPLEEALRLTSICGLGQVALLPLLSVLQGFPDALPGGGRPS